MLDFILEEIKIKSEVAIQDGHKFPGYYGQAPENYTKEELIMVLNIMYHEVRVLRNDIEEFEKRIFDK